MADKEAVLQEYAGLRDEIVALIERRSSRLGTTWAAVAALITAGALAQIPELGCIALLIVCTGWGDELRWADSTLRIGTYIRLVLEPEVEGLHWEAALYSAWAKGPVERSLLKRLFRSTFLGPAISHQVLTTACILVSLVLYANFLLLAPLIRLIVFCGLFLIGLAFTIGLWTESSNFTLKRRTLWTERFSEVLSEQKGASCHRDQASG